MMASAKLSKKVPSMMKNAKQGSDTIPNKKNDAYKLRVTRSLIMKKIRIPKAQALQAYQEELVATANLPLKNTFAPLRIVKKNSPTARIRTIWELPTHVRKVPISITPKGREITTAESIRRTYQIIKNQMGERMVYARHNKPHTLVQAQPASQAKVTHLPRSRKLNKQFASTSVFERLIFPKKQCSENKATMDRKKTIWQVKAENYKDLRDKLEEMRAFSGKTNIRRRLPNWMKKQHDIATVHVISIEGESLDDPEVCTINNDNLEHEDPESGAVQTRGQKQGQKV